MSEKETTYSAYIKNKFPQLDASNIRFINDGKYNDIAVVNNKVLFKFARYDWSVALLANEVKVLDFIRPIVGFPLPQADYLEPGIARFDYINGAPLYRGEMLLLNESDQNFLAKQLGTFFKQLHAIALDQVQAAGISEMAVDLSREALLAEYGRIKNKVFPYLDAHAKQSVESVFAPVLQNPDFLKFTPALIHGNPTAPHFLCGSGSKRINAVIGFGSAGIGDPAYDLGILFSSLGETFARRILRYYGDGTQLLDRARFYACLKRLKWAEQVCDRITTRDFSGFRFDDDAWDILPYSKIV